MDFLTIIQPLLDAGFDGQTIIMLVLAGVAYKVIKANGFARSSDIERLMKRIDEHAAASQGRDAKLDDRVAGLEERVRANERRVDVLDDRSRSGRCTGGGEG